MTGMRPLASAWRIRAAGLPEDMTGDAPAFRLPGTEDLAAFADLLGEDAPDAPADAPAQDAPFPLPAPIPPRVTGPVELCCEVDFGSLRAQEAELIIEQIQGRGRAYLDEEKIASFAPGARGQTPGALVLPLTRALQLGRKQTLRLCFDETRPAGVCGPVTLRLVQPRASGGRAHPPGRAASGDAPVSDRLRPRGRDVHPARAGRLSIVRRRAPAVGDHAAHGRGRAAGDGAIGQRARPALCPRHSV